MDLSIAALLAQDGLTNGAIYALLALSLVLVFTVTRVILVPAGEFLTIGTLTLAAFDQAHVPGSVFLVAGGALLAGLMEATLRARRREWGLLARGIAVWTLAPLALAGIAAWLAPQHLPLAAEVLLTLALTATLGPLTWRIVFQPIADAPVLVLLIVAVAVHLVLTGLGLYLFGAEGSRTGHIGMGLGFFIAKTLLERTGATVAFRNGRRRGAIVTARWPRASIEAVD